MIDKFKSLSFYNSKGDRLEVLERDRANIRYNIYFVMDEKEVLSAIGQSPLPAFLRTLETFVKG